VAPAAKNAVKHLDVVILAGGINRIPLYPGAKPGYKALLPFAGKPAIQYTLEDGRSGVAIASLRHGKQDDDSQ